jgi:4-phosphopantoate---beta-alanine ligase
MKILVDVCKKLSKDDLEKKPKFDNKKNLKKSVGTIRKNLRRMANA